jgi:hypothetical protein
MFITEWICSFSTISRNAQWIFSKIDLNTIIIDKN